MSRLLCLTELLRRGAPLERTGPGLSERPEPASLRGADTAYRRFRRARAAGATGLAPDAYECQS